MSRPSIRPLLQSTLEHAVQYLDGVDRVPVAALAPLQHLRERFQGDGLRDHGTDPLRVIEELVSAADGGLIASSGGRFYGWVVGGALPASVAADWLTTTWDQNAALFATAPAAAVAEEVAGAWLKELLGIPATASLAFVSGCEMAHVTCLLAARHHLLAMRGWDVERDGLIGAPRLRVLAGPEQHGSFTRALRFTGLGTACVERLPGDTNDRMRPEALAAALRPETPTIVHLQAGDINTGLSDDFAALIPIAHQHGAWVHVDGAFGLWAGASPRLAAEVRVVERADSWATDGHKWLNVPYDSGYAFVAHPEAHRASMAHTASYLTQSGEARDEMDWNPEWSRRARGFATWAALRELGRRGVADLIERCARHATALVNGIGALPGAEVACAATLNQGVVRFAATATRSADARTDAVMEAVRLGGEAFFTGTTWRGRRGMRVSVSSWRTTEADVARAIAAVATALEETRH